MTFSNFKPLHKSKSYSTETVGKWKKKQFFAGFEGKNYKNLKKSYLKFFENFMMAFSDLKIPLV